MARNPADFMHNWIDGNVGPGMHPGDVDYLAARCIADAKAIGLSPADVLEEVGTDIRTLISEAIENRP